MNKLFFVIALSFIFTAAVLPQDNGQEGGSHKRRAPMKKIEELEKIKLLDVLNLDEATSVKLFTRRNVNRTKIWDYEDKINNLTEVASSRLSRSRSLIFSSSSIFFIG